MVLGIRNKASTIAALAMAGVFAGGLSGQINKVVHADKSGPCPQCRKSWLVHSVTGAHYCHRCGYFTSKDGVVKTRTRDQDD